MRIAVLVKQVPKFEEMNLGADGRLVREGIELELNPYCRRAVSAGVTLADEHGGQCTVFTLGPPSAEDCVREAVAWGLAEGVTIDGIVVTDPAFAGSDTLATARALAAALRKEGPFDVVLCGRNSVDADTGQVGPEVAELLDLPFVGGVRALRIDGGVAHVRSELDDGWAMMEADLPVVLSCAERLCDPAKVDPPGRAAVPASLLRVLTAADLGNGPWGQAGSPTVVGELRTHVHPREGLLLEGTLAQQAEALAAILAERRVTAATVADAQVTVPDRVGVVAGPPVAVIVEPGRARVAEELLGSAAHVAAAGGRSVTAIVPGSYADLAALGSWGADEVVLVEGTAAAEDVAAAVAGWCAGVQPWAVLVPSTMWGREVVGRVAARLDAGLTGDAVDLEEVSGRLVGWKPAFGGQFVAAVTSSSPVQMVTVRPGVLAVPRPRTTAAACIATLAAAPRGRVRTLDSGHDDDVEALASARVVVGVGAGVDPARYSDVERFAALLGGTVGATRKVTDKERMPRARQIGITGRSIEPDLYVALGVSGRFNHMVGVRSAGFVVAVNTDPTAPVFKAADVGVVADWSELLPLVAAALADGDRVHQSRSRD